MDRMTVASDYLCMVDRTFAERLRAAIEADDDLTPAGLATKAGLDNSTIRQLLSGKAVNPRVDTAMKICAALGTTLEEFLGLEYDPVQREIVRLYMQLSAEERRLLLGAAQGIAALHGKEPE
jgi:transcriptional regulator with XRE-family HTH domain